MGCITCMYVALLYKKTVPVLRWHHMSSKKKSEQVLTANPTTPGMSHSRVEEEKLNGKKRKAQQSLVES